MSQKIKLLSLSLTLICFLQLQAQTNTTEELEEFKLIIENTAYGISMKSLNGSAWLDLSFSMKKYNPQAVSQYGMTELENLSEHKDANLADYLFTITKTDEGIALKGLEGTAWKELRFTLQNGSKQAIDQFGMTNLN